MKTIGIIGKGTIGTHLAERITQQGDRICFMIGKAEAYHLEVLLTQHKPSAVCIAVSTSDNGDAACAYMLMCAKYNIPVVTCEKGALSYHAEKLSAYFEHTGYSATVGGGTMLISYLQARQVRVHARCIYSVLNGTLNYIFDEVTKGRHITQACAQAIARSYAEPGATSLSEIISSELKDVIMKACILHNTVLTDGCYIHPKMFTRRELSAHDIALLTKNAAYSRLIVSFHRDSQQTKTQYVLPPLFLDTESGWCIRIGFEDITQKKSVSWLPAGVLNAVHIHEYASTYTLSGPGAGKESTTTAMLADLARQCV